MFEVPDHETKPSEHELNMIKGSWQHWAAQLGFGAALAWHTFLPSFLDRAISIGRNTVSMGKEADMILWLRIFFPFSFL